MDKIDKIISLCEKKTSLIKELKEALLFERAIYFVDYLPDSKKYILIKKETSKIILDGDKQKLSRYLDKIKVKEFDVYYKSKLV